MLSITCEVMAGTTAGRYRPEMRSMTTTQPRPRPVGELLRQWRERRRLSQLELALLADTSTRHLSFVETGRSRPGRDLLLRLAERLEVPLRERNHLLLAGGYAPAFGQTALDAPEMAGVLAALRQVLAGHEPYPAVVVDRAWNLVEANAAVALLVGGADPELLAPPVNVLRASLHPGGMASRIVNLGEWRAHLFGRLRRQIALTADPGLAQLYEELRAYPCDQPEPDVEVPGPGDVVVPLRLRHGDRELSLLSIMASFGTPLDVTVAELAIESFFPADPATSSALHDLVAGAGDAPAVPAPG
jgi:transcriptional regulator with XRE-family HTH domain